VKCKHQVPGETIFPELKRGMIAKCDNCLKLASASNKNRKRANNSDTWKKRKRAKNGGEHKKKRYSEDSSAEEEEVNFREAGVMKVTHN
jgi:NAD-dependent histone deacetylase SIR2